MSACLEAITGRYMRLKIWGERHRLYWEEAGEGIPLLCLHTAGSDGRQYRNLLNDEEITRLKRENAKLREERDFLKDAAVFFARESK